MNKAEAYPWIGATIGGISGLLIAVILYGFDEITIINSTFSLCMIIGGISGCITGGAITKGEFVGNIAFSCSLGAVALGFVPAIIITLVGIVVAWAVFGVTEGEPFAVAMAVCVSIGYFIGWGQALFDLSDEYNKVDGTDKYLDEILTCGIIGGIIGAITFAILHPIPFPPGPGSILGHCIIGLICGTIMGSIISGVGKKAIIGVIYGTISGSILWGLITDNLGIPIISSIGIIGYVVGKPIGKLAEAQRGAKYERQRIRKIEEERKKREEFERERIKREEERRRLEYEQKIRGYKSKVEQWEREGYDVSKLKRRWFK